METSVFRNRNITLLLSACAVAAAALALVAVMRDVPAAMRAPRPDAGVATHAPAPAGPLTTPAPMRATTTAGAAASGATLYDPAKPLGQQLPGLRARAARGDGYAVCVLATVLDACATQMMGSDEARWQDASADSAIESGDGRQLDRMSATVEQYRARGRMCADVTQQDMLERDDWMYRSAEAGDPRSMARFALEPDITGVMRLDDMDRMIAYRKSAEDMLNRAADAGVPEAILGVYRAYSSGEIASRVGEVPVKTDAAKAAGAARALLPTLSADERRDTERDVNAMIARMDIAQQKRMAAMERHYRQAYASRDDAAEPVRDTGVQTPGSACAARAE